MESEQRRELRLVPAGKRRCFVPTPRLQCKRAAAAAHLAAVCEASALSTHILHVPQPGHSLERRAPGPRLEPARRRCGGGGLALGRRGVVEPARKRLRCIWGAQLTLGERRRWRRHVRVASARSRCAQPQCTLRMLTCPAVRSHSTSVIPHAKRPYGDHTMAA